MSASDIQTIRGLVRELSGELTTLNRQVAVREEMRDGDLGIFDVLARTGPTSPGALARATATLPATLNAALDRLEQSGWIERRRDPAGGTGVLVHAMANRARELTANYTGLNTAIDKICGGYGPAELAVVADFLDQLAAAARAANAEIALGVR
jgi:DNA-binding MarR family transcriptional regulator